MMYYPERIKQAPLIGYTGFGGGATGLCGVGAGGCPNTSTFVGSRCYTAAGYVSSWVSSMEYLTIQTTSNGSDFGDLTGPDFHDGCSNGTRGVFGGYHGPGAMDYITCDTGSNASDFGNLTSDRGPGAASDGAYALFGAGYFSSQWHKAIDYVCVATPADATDFGDCTFGKHGLKGISDDVRAIFGGGENSASGGWTNIIDYVTVQTPGDASDFGDMTDGRHGYAGYGNGTRGIMAGGDTGSWGDTIEYITAASTGNASDFGDLTQSRYGFGGACDATRGVHTGGYATSGGGGANLNYIDYITISSTGNATDFGDLYEPRRSHACLSGGS